MDMPLGAFDLETTGPDPREARVVTACLAAIDGPKVQVDNWLVDPGIEIPEGATKVHGISTEIARTEGIDYLIGLKAVRERLGAMWAEGRIVAAYNASYDLTVIQTESARLGLAPMIIGPTVDPFVLDHHADPDRTGKRKLTDAIRTYGLSIGKAHTAEADALAAARLAWVIARRYPEIGRLDVQTLMQRQALWYAHRGEKLKQRFREIAESKQKRAQAMLDQAQEWRDRADGVAMLWPIQ